MCGPVLLFSGTLVCVSEVEIRWFSVSEVCVWVGVGWSCKWVFMDEWGRHELGVSGTYLTRGRVRPADVQIRAQSFARL